jgi:hypothetical protein
MSLDFLWGAVRQQTFAMVVALTLAGSVPTTYAQITNMDSLSVKMKNLTSRSSFDSLGSKVKNLAQYLWYRDHDTAYITNYSDLVALKLLAVNKYTFFRLRDKQNDASIGYRPELGLNLGLGVTYSWFSLDLAFNIGIRENNIPNSDFFDIQGAIFSPKILVETTLQYYYGYQVSYTEGFNQSNLGDAGIRPDIRTINLVLSTTYALNYGRFSLKAPFVFSEAQRKSAGSPVFGASFAYYNLSSDSSTVPVPVQDVFDENLHLRDFTALSLVFNAGYMYTFVYKKHWFLNVGGIPGISVSTGDYQTDVRRRRNAYVSYLIKLTGSLGYNGPRWFGGLQVLGDINQERVGPRLPIISGHGKTKFFVGYRLGSGNKK